VADAPLPEELQEFLRLLRDEAVGVE